MMCISPKTWFVLFLFFLLAHPSTANSDCGESESTTPFFLPATITLDRVRRCRNGPFLPCNSILVRDDYKVFDDAMSKNRAKKLYLAQVNEPPKASTRNVAIFFAGQGFNDGLESGLTGQRNGFEFSRKVGTSQYTLASDSLARRIFNTRFFSRLDTFVGLVFDARFNYEYGNSKKDSTEAAYERYIVGKLGSQVETIYLAGHSRGGCLAMRLAKKLSSRYPRARIITHTFDPVCADDRIIGGREFGVNNNPRQDNPLVANSDFYVHTTNMESQFSSTQQRECLDIRAQLSGGPATVELLDAIYRVRGMGHTGFGDAANSLIQNGRNWYTQTFHTEGHNGIDSSLNRWNQAVDQFRAVMEDMPCPCGTPLPPTRSPTNRPTTPRTPPPQPCNQIRNRNLRASELLLIDDGRDCPPDGTLRPISAPSPRPPTPLPPSPTRIIRDP